MAGGTKRPKRAKPRARTPAAPRRPVLGNDPFERGAAPREPVSLRSTTTATSTPTATRTPTPTPTPAHGSVRPEPVEGRTHTATATRTAVATITAATTTSAPTLDLEPRIVGEIRAALRGCTVDGLASALAAPPPRVDAALQALLAKGTVAQRGTRWFMS